MEVYGLLPGSARCATTSSGCHSTVVLMLSRDEQASRAALSSFSRWTSSELIARRLQDACFRHRGPEPRVRGRSAAGARPLRQSRTVVGRSRFDRQSRCAAVATTPCQIIVVNWPELRIQQQTLGIASCLADDVARRGRCDCLTDQLAGVAGGGSSSRSNRRSMMKSCKSSPACSQYFFISYQNRQPSSV